MTLLEQETAKYETVWADERYRVANQGLQLWQLHRGIFPAAPSCALDIGCGNGRMFGQWNREGIEGHGVDFAANALDPDHPNRRNFTLQCLWTMRFDREFDLGVCADVMEHIPPDKVDDVLRAISASCRTAVFQIANYPSCFGDLHLTLQPSDWWLAKLDEFGEAEFLPAVKRDGVEEYVFRLTR